jgi:hypothetical protein
VQANQGRVVRIDPSYAPSQPAQSRDCVLEGISRDLDRRAQPDDTRSNSLAYLAVVRCDELLAHHLMEPDGTDVPRRCLRNSEREMLAEVAHVNLPAVFPSLVLFDARNND